MSARVARWLLPGVLLLGAPWTVGAGQPEAGVSDRAQTPAAAPAVRVFHARAYAPQTRERLYTEHHRVELVAGRPVRETVTYRGKDGRVFARKRLRYGAELTAPSFRFEDERSGRMEQVERAGRNWVVRHREGRDDEIETEILRTADNAIVDEGYRMLLQDNLSALRRGRALVREAIVPSRLSSYDMRFSGRGMTTRSGQRVLRVHLDMDDLLLRLVGPEADLYFDLDSGRMLEFVGLANIRDDDDDPQQARIIYRHE